MRTFRSNWFLVFALAGLVACTPAPVGVDPDTTSLARAQADDDHHVQARQFTSFQGHMPSSTVASPTPVDRDWSPYVTGAAATREDSITGLQPDFQIGLYAFLQAADAELGPGLQIFSGYRSVERQEQLWKEAVAKYGSESEARHWVAPPGRSQHNHGNAVDLMWDGERLDSAPQHVIGWAHANAGEYDLGFVLAWEAWHLELLGARHSGT